MMDNVRDDEYILFVWRNSKSVLIGRHQNAYSECNLNHMKNDNVKLIRRTSGGGAVYFDEGNVTFSFIAKDPHYDKEFNYKIITDALRSLGFITELSGRNDILLNGSKISGNAFFHKGITHLHHGTILYNVNTKDMEKYLNVSKKKLESKGVKSVRSRVTNLINYKPTLKYEDITNALYETLCHIAGEKLPIKTHEDITKENLDSLKYYKKHISEEWIFGRNPEFNIFFGNKFSWGEVEFRLLVINNKIKDVVIFTDSLFPEYFDKINTALVGVNYNANSMLKALSENINIDDFVSLVNSDQSKTKEVKQILKEITDDISEMFCKHI